MDRSEKFTDSSKKIELIVRKVYELKKTDPTVKILIFSQWLDILNALKSELLANEIPSRSVINTGKSFQKMVEEFKVSAPCSGPFIRLHLNGNLLFSHRIPVRI